MGKIKLVVWCNIFLYRLFLDCCRMGDDNEMNEGFASYSVKWLLMDEEGNQWWEEFAEMSLHDFEVAYGCILHKILEVEVRLLK